MELNATEFFKWYFSLEKLWKLSSVKIFSKNYNYVNSLSSPCSQFLIKNTYFFFPKVHWQVRFFSLLQWNLVTYRWLLIKNIWEFFLISSHIHNYAKNPLLTMTTYIQSNKVRERVNDINRQNKFSTFRISLYF